MVSKPDAPSTAAAVLEPPSEHLADSKRAPESERDAWLDEVDAEHETIEWPERPAALRALDERHARATPSERVAHLFPRAETEWSIGELRYERSRRAVAG